MMTFGKKKLSASVTYTVLGILFGLLFPLLSTFIDIKIRGLSLTFSAILQVQKTNPLLWVIDTAPLFLGIIAWIAGIRQQKLQDQADRFEDLVESRSKEVINQKLFYEALVQNNPLAIVTLDKDHRIITINPAFTEMFGYHQGEITGKEIDPLIANFDCIIEEASSITHGVLMGKPMHAYAKRQRKDGTLLDVEVFGQPIMVNGRQIGALGLYRDISIEKQAQESLTASEERFRRMFTDSPIALRMQDFSKVKQWIDGKSEDIRAHFKEYLTTHPEVVVELFSLINIIEFNTAASQLFNAVTKHDLQGKIYSLLSKESRSQAIEIFYDLQVGITSLERELVYTRMDGKVIYTLTKISVMPGFEKSWGRILFSTVDITDRKMVEERLTYISLHDIMTAVYNRAFFEEEMARYEKGRVRPISILVMDMDNLKIINDQYGHLAGDSALQNIANIIQSSFREEDIVARIGGDEFAVLLPEVNPQMAQKARDRILNGITRYNNDNPDALPLSLSIGYATADKNESLEEAFKRADEAMYLEKKTKKNK